MKNKKYCPECAWKYPTFSPPGKRKDGVSFNCPNCETRLIYHTGLGEKTNRVIGIITSLGVIMFVVVRRFDDNLKIQLGIFSIVLIVGAITMRHFSNIEYLTLEKDPISND